MQESRGTQADLTTLPSSHRYVGMFGMERLAGTSSEGGTFIGIREELFDRISEHDIVVHRRGRATTWSTRTSDYFEQIYSDYFELMQHDFTFPRLARGAEGPSAFSRIDRIDCSLHPTSLEGYKVQVAVRGGWERGKVASDHRAVTLRIDRRTEPGRRRLKPYVAAHPDFAKVMAEEELLTADMASRSARGRSSGHAEIVARPRWATILFLGCGPSWSVELS